MEQFPLVLSDTTMPDEDLSLKFLALVCIHFINSFIVIVYSFLVEDDFNVT